MTIKAEHAGDWNCVLASLAMIEGRSPNAILADIAACTQDGEVTVDMDGFMPRAPYWRYLDGKGWQRLLVTLATDGQLPSFPPTCFVILKGHAFAIVHGVIFDNGSAVRWGRPIEAVYVPPK